MTIQRQNEIKVGVLFTIGLVGAFFTYMYIEKSAFSAGYREYILEFDFVGDLWEGSHVRFAGGIKCGYVERMEPAGNRSWVYIQVKDDISVTDTTKFSVQTAGLLGEKYIYLEPGEEAGTRLEEGSVIKGVSPWSLDKIFVDAQDLIGEIKGTVSMVNDALRETGTDEAIGLIANIDGLITDAREAVRTVTGSLKGENEMLQPIIEDVKHFTHTANVIGESAKRIMYKAEQVLNTIDVPEIRRTIQQIATVIEHVENVLGGISGNLNQFLEHGDEALQKLTDEGVDLLAHLKEKLDNVEGKLNEVMDLGKEKVEEVFEGPNGVNAIAGDARAVVAKLGTSADELIIEMNDLIHTINPVVEKLDLIIIKLNEALREDSTVLGSIINRDDVGENFQEIIRNLRIIIGELKASPLFGDSDVPSRY
jgi:phospholipid/cholesterol/gamma-HCH transport system substrate-binding protein